MTPQTPSLTERVASLAALAVHVGANVQTGQIVAVEANIAKADVAAAVAEAAYAAGARYVDLNLEDLRVAAARARHGDPETYSFTPPWDDERYTALGAHRAAWIYLAGPSQPDVLEGLDPAVIAQLAPVTPPGVLPVLGARTTNWTVVPAPTAAWAQIAHPDLPGDQGLAVLWDELAHACRLDESDPLAAWDTRLAELQQAADALTARRFDAVRLTGPGTELTIGLLASSRWGTAAQQTVDGLTHRANLPSEEVLTAPDPGRANGVVTATRPVVIGGVVVEGLVMSFTDGQVQRIDATRNADVVRAMVDGNDGAGRLGELALVDRSGRVGGLGTIFHSALLDENAASHIALGAAFPFLVDSDEDRRRLNTSHVHVDFLIGSDAVSVDGLDADERVTPLLRDGNWQPLT